MLRRTKGALALVLAVLLCALAGTSALAYPDGSFPKQTVRGELRASMLTEGAVVTLTGDTVLELDVSRTIRHLEIADAGASPGQGARRPTLTIRGSGTLTIVDGAVLDTVRIESGTVIVNGERRWFGGSLEAAKLIMTGGSLRATAAVGSSRSGLGVDEIELHGGALEGRDGGDGYGVECTGCMTVTGGTVSGMGQFSGVKAQQLLVSGGMVTGVGMGQGGEFDSCDGVFTEVLKISGGTVQGTGSAAGVTAERMILLSEGARVVQPAGGSVSADPVVIPAWGSDAEPYRTYTVLGSSGATATSVRLGTPQAGFTDVPAGQYYAAPVEWAAAQGITTGTGGSSFSPGQTCTRAQVVTFLWRAAGRPEPLADGTRFTDVRITDYFYQAVLWAVENGITNGVDDAHFAPNATCTRGHVVTFLYRFEHSPAVTIGNPFTDVRAQDYFYSAVLWAVSRGVTNGVSATQFAPANGCTRGQVVTFLYRDLHRTPAPETLPAA